MEISGVDLIRWGDKLVVHAEIDGAWVEVISAPVAPPDAYSQIVDAPQLLKIVAMFKALKEIPHGIEFSTRFWAVFPPTGGKVPCRWGRASSGRRTLRWAALARAPGCATTTPIRALRAPAIPPLQHSPARP